MDDRDILVESGEDQSPRTSCETGTGSPSVQQDGGDSDDSELYDTDVESEANRPTSAGKCTMCGSVLLVSCLTEQPPSGVLCDFCCVCMYVCQTITLYS